MSPQPGPSQDAARIGQRGSADSSPGPKLPGPLDSGHLVELGLTRVPLPILLHLRILGEQPCRSKGKAPQAQGTIKAKWRLQNSLNTATAGGAGGFQGNAGCLLSLRRTPHRPPSRDGLDAEGNSQGLGPHESPENIGALQSLHLRLRIYRLSSPLPALKPGPALQAQRRRRPASPPRLKAPPRPLFLGRLPVPLGLFPLQPRVPGSRCHEPCACSVRQEVGSHRVTDAVVTTWIGRQSCKHGGC